MLTGIPWERAKKNRLNPKGLSRKKRREEMKCKYTCKQHA
jgi:hypothetical protein